MTQRYGAFGPVHGAGSGGLGTKVSIPLIAAVLLGLDISPQLFHTVGVMAKGDNLGEFELLILAALMMLGDNAYGMTVHEQVEKLAAGLRTVSPWFVRLHDVGPAGTKGLREVIIASDPTPERGGRSKRFFEITGAGENDSEESP